VPGEPSIAQLHHAWRRAADYAEAVAANGWMAGRHDVSNFWRENLDLRRSYPSFNDALVLRRGATWPLAERGAEAADEEQERPWAESAWFVASREVPPSLLRSIDESSLGAPVTFEFDGRPYSAGFLTNAITTARLVQWVRERGLDRPLRILEIGAGYGQVAHQLHQLLPIELYAVCDLPENLFLSAYFLPGTLGREGTFVGPDDPVPERGLAFTIPPFIHRLGGGFDLIVNSYSFQEMTLQSVEEYFDFARAGLSDDGLFYSLNSHGKDGAGIDRPSDYPVDGFALLGFAPVRRFAFQALATHPYELVLGNGSPPGNVAVALDALGGALQLGLHDEVEPLAERLSAGALSDSDRRWLEGGARLFATGPVEEKERALAELAAAGVAPAATAFLRGALAHATGGEAQGHLREAIVGMNGSYAHALALTMTGQGAAAAAVVPFQRRELESLARHPRRLAAHVGRLLGLPREVLPRRLPGPLATMADAVRAPRRSTRSS
jgi:putative sugar O-methyltransferase